MNPLHGRDFLKETDFTPRELAYLLDLAAWLRQAKKARREPRWLDGLNIALIFEKTSTRTRCAFEVAAHDQGAHVTCLDPAGSQLGKKESIADTARVLSGFFDGIEYRGFAQARVEELAAHADVPVWNGLTNEWHPTQLLADMLTIRENSSMPLNECSLAYLGDARFNMGNSLMIGSALLGLDYRCVAPKSLWTSDEIFEKAREIAARTGARIERHEGVAEGVKGADYVYTDVWLSMGEPEEAWEERIKQLLPYRVTKEVIELTGRPESRFLHCLPAFHDRGTEIGERIFQRFGLDCMEVNDDVFESERSLVFEEAENRLHTIKAVMVATLSDREF